MRQPQAATSTLLQRFSLSYSLSFSVSMQHKSCSDDGCSEISLFIWKNKSVPLNTHNTYDSWATNEISINKAAHGSLNSKETVQSTFSYFTVEIATYIVMHLQCDAHCIF